MKQIEENLTVEIDDGILNDTSISGFVKITKLGQAQQTTVSIEYLKRTLEILAALDGLGYATVTVTVQNDFPLIIGGKKFGFALAPRREGDMR